MDLRRLYWLLGLIAVVALPMMFVTTNVRVAFNSQSLYTYAIDAFDAPLTTGLARGELLKGTQGIIDYFNSDEDLYSVRVLGPDGVEEPFFTDREALHFRDVRSLLRGVYTLQAVTTLLVLVAVMAMAVAVLRGRSDLASLILRRLRLSGFITVGAIAVIGLFASVGGFDFLFLQFHLLSFSNDLWQGTATDRMVLLFPEVFFFQATMLIGLATAVEVGLVILAATFSLRSLRKRRENAL